ncbi:MAG: ArsR family transcriptional regulator [Alphaproteobacteria bacterium]|nr:ArsR family transcriptional regulator [Alphaproteobacteria bacterium]
MSINPKKALFAEFASVARAIGHPARLEVIESLAQGERGVEALASRLNMPIANVSQHLQNLRRVGLVACRREGKFIIYRLVGEEILTMLRSVQRVAECNVAEVGKIVQQFYSERDDMEPIARTELLHLMRQGVVTVLDIRPADEFAAGHVPGAVNVQLSELEYELAALAPSQDIVAYCRGAYCVLSFEAVAKLRKHGFKAWRLEEGMPEWRAAGLPVEAV